MGINMIKNTVFVFILLLSLNACNTKDKTSRPLKLKLNVYKSIEEFQDSSFLTNMVLCMDVSSNKILLTDYNASQIIVLDKKVNIVKRLGGKGNGPGEFVGTAHFCLDKNHIYTINDAGNAIVDILNEKYLKSIHFPENSNLTTWTRFFCHNNFFYHSVDMLKSPVFCFNEKGGKNICNFTKWDNRELSSHSSRHLVKGLNSFYVVGQTLPIFQEYSFEGRLLRNYELVEIPEIKKIMEVYKSSNQVQNTYFVMIQDVYYYNKNLYMLLASKEDRYTCNRIVVFNVENKIKHIATLELNDNVFQSFCVFDNKLIAFNSLKASLDVFIIPNLN